MKFTPQLRFVLDDSIERGNRVLNILEEIEKQDIAPSPNDLPGQDHRTHHRRICSTARTICVVGHVRPDGDCIGSQLGLAMALKNQGKKVVCWNEDTLPDKLAFLDPEKIFRHRNRARFDVVIATDCASFERLGNVGPVHRRAPALHQY